MPLQTADPILHNGEVLVLNGRRDLHHRGACVKELNRGVRRVGTPGGKNREALKLLGNSADHAQGNGAHHVPRAASVRGHPLGADAGPGSAVHLDVLQTADGVDGGHSGGASFLGGSGDVADVCWGMFFFGNLLVEGNEKSAVKPNDWFSLYCFLLFGLCFLPKHQFGVAKEVLKL